MHTVTTINECQSPLYTQKNSVRKISHEVGQVTTGRQKLRGRITKGEHTAEEHISSLDEGRITKGEDTAEHISSLDEGRIQKACS